MLYREVLSRSALSVARRAGWALRDADSFFLAVSLPSWKPFDDTNPALERLAKNHRLGILSNVDDDLLAGTLKHFTTRFDITVTAEKVRSYKPEFGHFEEARRVVGNGPWIHVASSQYHDIEPAVALGIKAVWVNRKGSFPSHHYSTRDVVEVRDLSQLADWSEQGRVRYG